MSDQRQLIVFNLGNEEFGVEIKEVREIIRLPEITKFPQAAGHIEGIINLRGNLLSLVNLHRCLGLQSTKKRSSARVIVVNLENGRKAGIMVDFVSDIVNLDKEAIDPPPSLVGHKYIQGIVKINNRIIMLLKLREILPTEERKKLTEIKPFNQKLPLRRAGLKES